MPWRRKILYGHAIHRYYNILTMISTSLFDSNVTVFLGYVIAEAFKRPVFVYSKEWSYSIFPTSSPGQVSESVPIALLFDTPSAAQKDAVGHFWNLNLTNNCPVPPKIFNSDSYIPDPVMKQWDIRFNGRIAAFKLPETKLFMPKRKVRDEDLQRPEEEKRRRFNEEIDKIYEEIKTKKKIEQETVFCPICEKNLSQKCGYDGLPSTLKTMYANIKQLQEQRNNYLHRNFYLDGSVMPIAPFGSAEKQKKMLTIQETEIHLLRSVVLPRLEDLQKKFCAAHCHRQYLPLIKKYSCITIDFNDLCSKAVQIHDEISESLLRGEIISTFEADAIKLLEAKKVSMTAFYCADKHMFLVNEIFLCIHFNFYLIESFLAWILW